MRKAFLILLLLSLLIISLGCSNSAEKQQIELIVSAAASLSDALAEVKVAFEAEHTNVKIILNLAGSGKLAQQIVQGAPANIFLSANQSYMDQLVKKELVNIDSRINFASNSLALVINPRSNLTITSFTDINPDSIKQIAIGEPTSVPAGMYAKEVFEALNLWGDLEDKLVLAKDVRQVLTYVESGNVDFGIVYASDTIGSDKIKIVAIAEDSLHQPIIYPAAIIADSINQEYSQLFLDFLASQRGKQLLSKYGFNN